MENKCIICNKLLSDKKSKRCLSCSKKDKLNPSYKDGRTKKIKYCIDCNKKVSLSKYKRCKKCSEKYFKNRLHRHHMDLNNKNNENHNLLYLKIGNHERLHKKAYNYLIRTNQIEDYIKWFAIEFKPTFYTEKDYKQEYKNG